MSGFYYQTKMADLQLTTSQLRKIRDYIRTEIRGVAAIDSGEFLRSLATQWDSKSATLTVYSPLYYAGYIEGGTIYYRQHMDKVGKVLRRTGLKITPIQYT
tara:strand:- start:717 stop:1019 length:303 start_codon:yes stop_codon:yes gene_type:complete